MKIASIETGIVRLPNDEPLAGFSENPNATNPIVTLRMRTDDGIEGIGVTYFGGALTGALRNAVDELGALIVGEDPLRVEAVAAKLRSAAGSAGPGGITAALSTPVAGGEYLWGIVPFRHVVEARSVDIVMIDLVRVGGITQWLKVAGMAEAFNLPVVSHLIPEGHVHLISAIPNGLTVEYMPWLTRLFEEVPQPQNGELVMPTAPGLGLKFDDAAINRYRA